MSSVGLEDLGRLGGWRLARRLMEVARGEAREELARIAEALAPPDEEDDDLALDERGPVPGFEAWEHGDAARCATTDEERGRCLDRALDAFDAIARTPIDPGNDEGPMWAIASLLDEPRLRRGLAIADRMEGAGWTYALGGTRAALTTRLAALGHVDEALSSIRAIGGTDPFAPHWRAVAAGGVLGALLAADPDLRSEELLARLEEPPVDDGLRYRVLDALLDACPSPPSADSVRSWLVFTQGLSPRSRQLAVQHVAGAWTSALPSGEWVRACEELPVPVDALLDVADALPDPRAALEAALRLVGTSTSALVEVFPALAEHRHRLAPRELRPAWEAWLASLADEDGARAVLDVEGVEELVLALEGPDVVLALGRAMAPRPPG